MHNVWCVNRCVDVNAKKKKFANMPLWKKKDGQRRSDLEDDDRRNNDSEPPIIKKTAKETHDIR